MFAKLSLKSFVYELAEILFFLSNKTKAIYGNYMIEQVFPYSVLTDTGSISFFFIFICKTESNTPEEKFRDVLFQFICENKVLHKFDISHKFWEMFGVRNTSLKKKLGYAVESTVDIPISSLHLILRSTLRNLRAKKRLRNKRDLRREPWGWNSKTMQKG